MDTPTTTRQAPRGLRRRLQGPTWTVTALAIALLRTSEGRFF